jgi:shikimate dehydrogenase
MRKYGLIGYPLGHSFSKKYFTEKFHNEHIVDSFYETYPLTDLNLITTLIVSEPCLTGLNVTIPYKSAIIRYLDWISPEAREIGAVNVVKIKRTGESFKLLGFNSDVTGIRDSIVHYVDNSVVNALVLGTGGSSRAVCYVLREMGINVTLVSRQSKADIISYSDITSEILKRNRLIVNTTPLGMYPDIESYPDIDYNSLSRANILFDLVYNPEITSFLRMGAEHGCTVVSGLKMLHSQAEKSWEIWNDDSL